MQKTHYVLGTTTKNMQAMQQLLKKDIKNPPLGSSDLQVKLKVVRMVDGFRPGRIVRVKGPWTYVLLPWDEHINSEEAYERSKKMILP